MFNINHFSNAVILSIINICHTIRILRTIFFSFSLDALCLRGNDTRARTLGFSRLPGYFKPAHLKSHSTHSVTIAPFWPRGHLAGDGAIHCACAVTPGHRHNPLTSIVIDSDTVTAHAQYVTALDSRAAWDLGLWKQQFHSFVIHSPHSKWPGPLLLTRINFDPSMDNNYIHYKVWDERNYAFPNFNVCTVEVWEWIRHLSHG